MQASIINNAVSYLRIILFAKCNKHNRYVSQPMNQGSEPLFDHLSVLSIFVNEIVAGSRQTLDLRICASQPHVACNNLTSSYFRATLIL
jgi:hypothetical protein